MICRICGIEARDEHDICEGCREYLYRSRSGCAVYEGYLAYPRSLQDQRLVSLRLGNKYYGPSEIEGWGCYEVAREVEKLGFVYDRSSKPSQNGRARAIQKVFFNKGGK